MSNLSVHAILSRPSFFNFVYRTRCVCVCVCVYCMATYFCTVYFAVFHHMLFAFFLLFLILLLSLLLVMFTYEYTQSVWERERERERKLDLKRKHMWMFSAEPSYQMTQFIFMARTHEHIHINAVIWSIEQAHQLHWKPHDVCSQRLHHFMQHRHYSWFYAHTSHSHSLSP